MYHTHMHKYIYKYIFISHSFPVYMSCIPITPFSSLICAVSLRHERKEGISVRSIALLHLGLFLLNMKCFSCRYVATGLVVKACHVFGCIVNEDSFFFPFM